MHRTGLSEDAGQDLAIGIPAYRANGTIVETLESLQCQAGIEQVGHVLLIDDGSRDNIEATARSCWRVDVPLTVEVLPENIGQWQVTNRILSRLDRFSWVGMLHADDVLKPGWLAAILSAIRTAPEFAATVCTHYDRWFPARNEIKPQTELTEPRIAWYSGSEAAVGHTLMSGCWWHISGSAISTAAIREIGGFDIAFPYSSDWEWLLRVFAKKWSAGIYRESLMLYRMHEQSVSSSSLAKGLDISEGLRMLKRYAGESNLSEEVIRQRRRGFLKNCLRRVATRLLRRDLAGAMNHLRILLSER
jgi:glycosyltransferase involved in cell wall biosynthesis